MIIWDQNFETASKMFFKADFASDASNISKASNAFCLNSRDCSLHPASILSSIRSKTYI
uniref:Uncharacterized protein n=1 Tax=Octopus bimaculoides TaxID=37653 RepID=A0A0L8HDK8_OCTBM